ncbi:MULTISPECIES: hypothetical protein [Rhizobium]|uniref:Uncharacterized protein n=1 Tax=Rhizobium paranaense TaxID=1650438 RepID=A0A7W8XW98_9HYPH|nr:MULTISPECIES: hypothetical protein [Rhizobium]MBB5576758.1 hypothetical protein [Rhizobium paranaense]
MSAEPPASPEAKLARILAWLQEKFTRNFSVGKDLWELPKTRSKELISEHFRPQTAILLVKRGPTTDVAGTTSKVYHARDQLS